MPESAVFDSAALLQSANPHWTDPDRLGKAGSQRPLTGQAAATLHALLHALNGEAPPRVVWLEGQRQLGKTRLLSALTSGLLEAAYAAGRIAHLPLEHQPLRWCAPAAVLQAWDSTQGDLPGRRLLLVDDAQLWEQVTPDALLAWLHGGPHTLVLASVPHAAGVQRMLQAFQKEGLEVLRCALRSQSFADHLAQQQVQLDLPAAPRSLRETFDWPRATFLHMAGPLRALNQHFDHYLRQGCHPGAAQASSQNVAQAHLREQVVLRALRWDAPLLCGVRRGADLERALTYLAAHVGQLLDVPELCSELSVERPTVRHFLHLLEQAGLLQRIAPLGYGSEVQRARFLICLPDPALAAALLWQDGQALEGEARTAAVQSALFRHLDASYGARGASVSYAALGRGHFSLVVGSGRAVLPFGQYDLSNKATPRAVAGLVDFCREHGVQRGYVATRLAEDIGPLLLAHGDAMALMRLPAALLCLWLSATEQPQLQRLATLEGVA